jgi:NAD(P)H-flavin reductase
MDSARELFAKKDYKLFIKVYPKGSLTPKLINGDYKTLHLSCERGEGLRFGELKPGKIILVAGGTGLYPFCDLIYKSIFIKKQPTAKTLIAHDPILRTDIF